LLSESSHFVGQKSLIPSLPASDLSFRTAIEKGIYALCPILISFERTTIHKESSQCTLSTTKIGDRPTYHSKGFFKSQRDDHTRYTDVSELAVRCGVH